MLTCCNLLVANNRLGCVLLFKQNRMTISDMMNQMNKSTNNINVQGGSHSNFFKVISHWWTFDLLKVGRKRPLVIDDIDDIDKYDSSEYLLNKFLTNWSNEISDNENNPNLFWAIANTINIKFYVFLTFIVFLRFISLIVNLIFLQEILAFIEDCGDLNRNKNKISESDYYRTIGYCIGVFICGIFGPICLHYEAYHTTRLGINMRQVMTAVVLYKVLKISPNSVASAQVINLMSTDAQRYVVNVYGSS